MLEAFLFGIFIFFVTFFGLIVTGLAIAFFVWVFAFIFTAIPIFVLIPLIAVSLVIAICAVFFS